MGEKSVHVLFVHGVGHHSPLSSLLRAYQALRSDLNSPEAPTPWEDPFPDWRLADFDDSGPPPYLRLIPRFPGNQQGPDNVYLYEVNYSTLAGVIRANQRLDIARLFISFDLAVNVARAKLLRDLGTPNGAPDLLRHASVARHVQRLADVFVAATVPVLGIPSLIFRQFTSNFVGAFTRFFEDIATFAMDKNGEQLISHHVDRTVQNIVASKRFRPATVTEEGDTFVIAAHSLGTIVIHNFLLRHWPNGGPEIPAKLLTYGAPIGLVCWIWLLLDFPRLIFNTDPEQVTGDEYFCWSAQPTPTSQLRPIEWINVINFLDPIAAGFPLHYVNLAMTVGDIRNALANNGLTHHYIKTGNIFSAHTNYIDDREGFLELLGRIAGLKADTPPRPTSRDPSLHWQEVERKLLVMRWVLWGIGVVAICIYLDWLSSLCGVRSPWMMAIFYVWAPATVALLAFFQKLFFGAPTKRSRPSTIETLPWLDWWAFPYRLRSKLHAFDFVAKSTALRLCLGFVPTIIAMIAPILWWSHVQHQGASLIDLVSKHRYVLPFLLALFVAYAVAFALSEFTRHWRNLLRAVSGAAGAVQTAPDHANTMSPDQQH